MIDYRQCEITIGNNKKRKDYIKDFNEDEKTYMRIYNINNDKKLPIDTDIFRIVELDYDYSIKEIRNFLRNMLKRTYENSDEIIESFGMSTNKFLDYYCDYYVASRKQINRDKQRHKNIMNKFNNDRKSNKICEHNILKVKCKLGRNKQICKHKIIKNLCKKCKSKNICEHDRSRNGCIVCKGMINMGGSRICNHFCYKSSCRICNKKKYCKYEWCDNLKDGNDDLCLICKVNLHPNEFDTNYKTKEKLIESFIVKKYNNLTWIINKTIECSNSKKRPDITVDLGYQVIIIEIDENKHNNYICENKRIMRLSQDLQHRPLIIIRFNPDSYYDSDKKINILSCLKYSKNRFASICNKKDFEYRMNKLYDKIDYWIQNKSEKVLVVEKLFY